VAPGDFMMLRIGTDFAFEVHVVALLYVLRVQSAAQMQLYLRRNWKEFFGALLFHDDNEIFPQFRRREILKSPETTEYVKRQKHINKACDYL